MNWVDLNINELIKAEWNYKIDDIEISKTLSNNIKKNGLIENLIVRKLDDKYEVVNGNHRLDVLKKLNYKDKIKCFNLGTISLNAAKRIAIETNETKFNSNKLELESILSELAIDFGVDDIIESTI